MLLSYKFSDDSEIVLSQNKLQLDAKMSCAADNILSLEQQKGEKKLFNGTFLSATKCSNLTISAIMVEYKYYLAKLIDPILFGHLQIVPIAVSGILECKDGFVFGKRSRTVIQDSGKWELTPSGGIDCTNFTLGKPIDFKSQLLIELKEELGINSDAISDIKTFCYVFDPVSSVLDIGIWMKCSLDAKTIEARYEKLLLKEYDELSFVRKDCLERFFKHNSSQLVGISQELLNQHFRQIST